MITGAGRLRYVVSPDHRHWHVLGFDRYHLRRAGKRVPAVRDRKTGFCLGDRDLAGRRNLPGAPPNPVYTGRCGLDQPGAPRDRGGHRRQTRRLLPGKPRGAVPAAYGLAVGSLPARTPREPRSRPARARLHEQRGIAAPSAALAARRAVGSDSQLVRGYCPLRAPAGPHGARRMARGLGRITPPVEERPQRPGVEDLGGLAQPRRAVITDSIMFEPASMPSVEHTMSTPARSPRGRARRGGRGVRAGR